jgi:hypothetical protein
MQTLSHPQNIILTKEIQKKIDKHHTFHMKKLNMLTFTRITISNQWEEIIRNHFSQFEVHFGLKNINGLFDVS